MSIYPQIGEGSLGDISGVAERIRDLERRMGRQESTSSYIGDGSITGGTNGHLSAATIATSNLIAGSVTAAIIQAGAIQSGHIQAGAIDTAALAADSVTSAKILAGTIQATDIQTATLTSVQIAADTITSGNIAANAIQTSELDALAVTTAKIAAGAVDATKITVSSLSAITSNMGSLTAGTITGATMQSAASGSRWVGDSTGLRGYALDGVTKTFEINTGSGIATLTGVVIAASNSVVPGGTLTDNSLLASKFNVGVLSDNLVLNWSAEGGSTSGWGLVEGSGTALTSQTVSDAPHGDYTFRIAAGDGAYGHRAIPVRPGGTYSVRLRVKHSNGNGTHYVRMGERADYPTGDYVTSGNRTSLTDLASGVANSTITSWSLREYTYTVPAGIYWISPSVYNWSASTGTLDFDAFEIREQITANEIRAGSITTNTLAAGAVTAQKITIAALDSTTGNIVANAVGNTQLGPDSVTTSKILAGTILATDIQAFEITAGQIAASTIDATRMTVTSLSAITANLGTITAGTITGATMQTATSGTRVVLDSVGLKAHEADGTNNVRLASADATLSMAAHPLGTTNSSGATIPNPSATTDLTGWAHVVGVAGDTLNRDTTTFDTSPAAFRYSLVSGTALSLAHHSLSGFVADQGYKLALKIRTDRALVAGENVEIRLGQYVSGSWVSWNTWNLNPGTSAFNAIVPWTFMYQNSFSSAAGGSASTPVLAIGANRTAAGGALNVYWDTIQIFDYIPSSSRQIKFMQSIPGGTPVGALQSAYFPDAGGTMVNLDSTPVATSYEESHARLGVRNPVDNTLYGAYRVRASPGGSGVSAAEIYAGAFKKQALSSFGGSDFMQLATILNSSADLTLAGGTVGPSDIPACTYTVPAGIVSARYIVVGVFDADATVAGGANAVGICSVGGTQQSRQALLWQSAGRATISQVWVTGAVNAGTVIKLMGSKSAGAGTFVFHTPHTTMLVFGPIN